MRVRSRDLVGRKIVGVRWNKFRSHPDTNPNATAGAPHIILDNGSVLRFVVQETEVGEYGVDLAMTKANQREY